MPYKNIALLGAALVIVAVVAGIVNYSTLKTPVETSTATSTPLTGPGYTIEQAAVSNPEILKPNLDRGIRFSDSIPAEIRPLIQKKADEAIAKLKNDPTDAGAWLNLALWYKTANDFDGAREVWEFLVQAAPQDTTSIENLAKMYHFDLQEYVKAEQYFKQSLALSRTRIEPYLGLFELYSLSYKKDTSAAVDIIRAAEKVFPQEAGLPFTLGAYYRDRRDIVRARKEFESALTLARAQNSLDLVAQLNAELAKLP